MTENRGRDVRPFLELLEAGRLDRYRYVCKIHGKKSNDGGRISYLGALWRRRSLFDLLAGPGIAESIVRAFEADESIGIIGPRAFRLPSETSPPAPSWGKTRPKVLELAAKMGVAAGRLSSRLLRRDHVLGPPRSATAAPRPQAGLAHFPRSKDCWTAASSTRPSACSRPRRSSSASSLLTVTGTNVTQGRDEGS